MALVAVPIASGLSLGIGLTSSITITTSLTTTVTIGAEALVAAAVLGGNVLWGVGGQLFNGAAMLVSNVVEGGSANASAGVSAGNGSGNDGGGGGGASAGARGGGGSGKWLKEMAKEIRKAINRFQRFGKFYKVDDKVWLSIDRAGHGGAAFKRWTEKGRGLLFNGSLDSNMKFMQNKHESLKGTMILFDCLKLVPK